MVKKKWILFMLLVLCATAYGADTKPSDESLKELLRITETQKLLDSSVGQIDSIMKAGMQQAFKGKTLTPRQQKQIDDMQDKMMTIFKQEMNWEMLEPLYLQVYRDSFTQEEIDGMLVFYKTPPGQAVVKKMPLVIQNTMSEMQKRSRLVLQKVLKMIEATVAEMKADEAKENK